MDNFIEIELTDPRAFGRIRETLTRIGIPSHKTKTLYQSVHILHKRGKYYIAHFKELFALDGLTSNFNEADRLKRDTVALLLEQWGHCRIVSRARISPQAGKERLFILPYEAKRNWTLVPKFHLGKRKRRSSLKTAERNNTLAA